MVKVAENIDDWTRGTIIDLIDEGYDENDVLEFKLNINAESERIAQTACAFANTSGGLIIFGIDNDRKKIMTATDRMVGLKDSDQLKRSIIDKIKNVKPSIPLECIHFKKSNIELPNKNVIVLLNILPSRLSPHQYKNIFYKRLSNGNEPMDVNEIRENLINSLKNERIINLISLEGGFLRDRMKMFLNEGMSSDLSLLLKLCKDLKTTIMPSFLLNHAYLYSYDVEEATLRILEAVDRINATPEFSEVFLNSDKEFLKEQNVSSGEEFIRKRLTQHAERAQKFLDILETSLGIKFTEPTNMTEIDLDLEKRAPNKS